MKPYISNILGKSRYRITIGLLILSLGVRAQVIPDSVKISYDASILPDSIRCSGHTQFIDRDTLIVAFHKALSYYPELCNVPVRIRYGKIKTSMAAQPRFWSIFRCRSRRKYQIIINKDESSQQARLIHAVPFDAKVGVLGHELAHILSYSSKSGWQITWVGIRYLNKKYRKRMERETDSVTISRGLGWQLYLYAYYIIYNADIDDAYRQYKLNYYMKPEEIYQTLTEFHEEE